MIYAAGIAAIIIVLSLIGWIVELRRRLAAADETIRTQKRLLDENRKRYVELVEGLGKLLNGGTNE